MVTNYNLLNPSTHYETHSQYAWAKENRKRHIAMHWDVEQINHSTTKVEFYALPIEIQQTFIRIIQFFTQADVCVCNNYLDNLIQIFKSQDVNAMLVSFADRENIHIEAYAGLAETLNFSQTELNAFFTQYKSIKEMEDKNKFLNDHTLQEIVAKMLSHRNSETNEFDPRGYKFSFKDKQEILKNLACFGAFTEGTQLYSSFAMLFEPSRSENGGVLQTIARIVEWSIKDESLHVASILQLFHTFKKENPEVWTEDLKKEIYIISGAVIHFEDAFIDYVFEPCNGQFMTISADKIKEYIRYIADIRLSQLGLKPTYNTKINPLPFMDEILNSGVANFFETAVTDYSHNTTKGSWSDCNYD